MTNAIESAVRIDRLASTAVVGDKRLPLRVEQLAAGQRLAPGESVDILLVAPEPIPSPGPDAILFDQSDVAVEADAQAIWTLAFDRSAAAQMTRQVTVEAVPLLFASPDRPNDRVAAFVVTIEHGGTVRLTETELKSTRQCASRSSRSSLGRPCRRSATAQRPGGVRVASGSASGARPTAPFSSPSRQRRAEKRWRHAPSPA